MTTGELGKRTGTSLEQVQRLVALRIVEPAEDDGFRPADVHRLRSAQALEEAEASLKDIGRVIRARWLGLTEDGVGIHGV